jgi:hypothetical protein
MQTVQFSLREGVKSSRRNSIVLQIAIWPEVKSVGFLYPRAQGPASRIACARLRDGASSETVLEKLKQIPELELPKSST